MIDAIPHTVERATMSNINSVAKSIAIFFYLSFFYTQSVKIKLLSLFEYNPFYRSFFKKLLPVFLNSGAKVLIVLVHSKSLCNFIPFLPILLTLVKLLILSN